MADEQTGQAPLLEQYTYLATAPLSDVTLHPYRSRQVTHLANIVEMLCHRLALVEAELQELRSEGTKTEKGGE